MNKEYISVFKPKRVRRLLRMGNNIYDIKPDKDNTDRTIFIFKNTDKLQKDIETLDKQGIW